jgi:hypothetical protein
MRSFKLLGGGCVAALKRSKAGKKGKKRMRTYIGGSEGKNGTGR